jgi:hypothetical protein
MYMTDRKQTQDATSSSMWARVTAGSFIIAELHRYQSRLIDKAVDAWTASSLQRLQHWIGNTSFTTGSYTADGGEQIAMTLQRWIRHAWGYQWLTAEPEPEVIVIDLRDTIVFGPILHLLGLIVPQESRVVQTISPYYQQMTVILRGARSSKEFRESRVVNLARALLEPPAPPERKSHDEETTMSKDKEETDSTTKIE